MNKPRISWDLDALKSDADCYKLADILGMRNGVFTECISGTPHVKMTHNQLFRDHCFCHACHTSYNAFDMVKQYHEVNGSSISVEEIGWILAEACPGPAESYMKETKRLTKEEWKRIEKAKKFPLTDEEIIAIGLVPEPDRTAGVVIKSCQDDKWDKWQQKKVRKITYTEDVMTKKPIIEMDVTWRAVYLRENTVDERNRFVKEGGMYCHQSKIKMPSLKSLYLDDEETFNELVKSKSEEKMESYRNIYEDFSNDTSEFAVSLVIEYKKKYEIAKKVFLRFGGIEKPRAKKLFNIPNIA